MRGPKTPRFHLPLAGGPKVEVFAADAAAQGPVAELGTIMQLGDEGGEPEGLLRLAVVGGADGFPGEAHGTVVHRLTSASDQGATRSGALDVAFGLRNLLARLGGVLVHGGLAEWPHHEGGPPGAGIILAGASGVGKSTASRRLPPPWLSWSDDTSLVVPDGTGGYRAHPWPTWSRLYDEGDVGYRCATRRSVPLAAAAFLEQSAQDLVQRIGAGEATARLLMTTRQSGRWVERITSRVDVRNRRLSHFGHVTRIAQNVPMFRLCLTLHGSFWKELEALLSGELRYCHCQQLE